MATCALVGCTKMKSLFLLLLTAVTCWSQTTPFQSSQTSIFVNGTTTRFVNTNSQASGPFTANTAKFSGTAQGYFAPPFVNVSDNNKCTVAFWLKCNGGNATTMRIMSGYSVANSAYRFFIDRTSANQIQINVKGPLNALLVSGISAQTITADGNWHHVYITFDVSGTTFHSMYFNGTLDSSATWPTFSNIGDTCQWTATTNTIAMYYDRTTLLNGSIAEFWFAPGQTNTTVASFYSGGHPVSLGATGQLPLGGTAPAVYLSLVGCGTSWGGDSSGNGNTYTALGSPTCDTSP